MGFNSAFKGLKLLNLRERAFEQFKWPPQCVKWTRPFRRKTKSGFCACPITFQTQSTTHSSCGCAWLNTVSLPHDIHSVVAPWYTQCRCPM